MSEVKFLTLTYVDADTNIPLKQEPAKNGIKIPDGVIPMFDIQSSRSNQAPIVYGWTDIEDFEVKDFMTQVEESSFFNAFKSELKDRARLKRKIVEQGGITIGSTYVGTSIEDQNRISNMVTSLNLVPELPEIDFEASPGQWVTISREQGLQMGAALTSHVQRCFSWCRGVHDKIESLELNMETIGEVQPILEDINSFGSPQAEIPEQEEPIVEQEPNQEPEQEPNQEPSE